MVDKIIKTMSLYFDFDLEIPETPTLKELPIIYTIDSHIYKMKSYINSKIKFTKKQ